MTLYTIVSMNDIFPGETPQAPVYERTRHGCVSLVKGENGFVVNSLFSTNPYDYLNPDFAPGKLYRNNKP